MSAITIRKVTGKRDLHTFLTFPWRIYKDDPLWVPPILADRYRTVDPKKGVFFQRGTAEFFIAWRDGKPVGTVCAAIDFKANANVNNKDCLFGFFEFINDRKVPFALLGFVKEWGLAHGLDHLYGPFNLDYEDGYGILIEGRDRPPAILCGHTPEYYVGVLEEYGFASARGSNLAYGREISNETHSFDEIKQFARRVRERKGFIIRSADLTCWQEEVDRVFELINPCLQHLPGFAPWQREALQELMAPFVKLADPELILFAELDGTAVGFFPAIPNFNEVLIHANGLRYPWDYLKTWLASKKPVRSASIKSVLVLPKYWGTGVAILMFAEMVERLAAKGYNWVDLSLTSDDNPRTPQLAERMGAKVYKRYQVYRMKI